MLLLWLTEADHFSGILFVYSGCAHTLYVCECVCVSGYVCQCVFSRYVMAVSGRIGTWLRKLATDIKSLSAMSLGIQQ